MHDFEVDIDRKAGKSSATALEADSASVAVCFAGSTFRRRSDIISTSGILEYQLKNAKVVLNVVFDSFLSTSPLKSLLMYMYAERFHPITIYYEWLVW
jgi:hypothetical protein